MANVAIMASVTYSKRIYSKRTYVKLNKSKEKGASVQIIIRIIQYHHL